MSREPKTGSILVAKDIRKENPINNILQYHDVCRRVCYWKCNEYALDNILNTEEIIRLDEIVKENIGISIAENIEFLGSIVLCMPDLILKGVRLRLQNNCQTVKINFYTRDNREIVGGTILLEDERKDGLGFIISKQIESDIMQVELPYEPHILHVRIFAKEGDCIEDISSTFIKDTLININVADKTRKVIYTDHGISKEAVIDTYTSISKNLTSSEQENVYEDIKLNHELEKLEKDKLFWYFTGNSDRQEEAIRTIKALISSTKKKCIMCDSYLSAMDILKYGIFLKNRDAELILVTSAAYISAGEYKNIEQVIRQLQTEIRIRCYVLSGNKKSPLHDRWLVIDDVVYMLGSSFNEFASRATCMFRVPSPKSILRDINIWIEKELELRSWKTNHVKE